MSISSPILALTEGDPRAVTISGQPAGTVTFVYLANVKGPTGSCAYRMRWESPLRGPQPAVCRVRELKLLGHTSCLANSLANITTSVVSVPICWAFDQLGLPNQVTLVLAESDIAPTLRGVVTFTSSPFLPQAIIIE
ncbi:MAG: hypothetical protein ACMG6S_10130 [Byssovorax sp.]